MCWWQGALDEGRALGHGLGAVAQQPYWKGWQAPAWTRANNVLALQGRRTPGWATGADKGPPGCCHPCCLVQGRPHLGATSSSGMPGERDVEMIRGGWQTVSKPAAGGGWSRVCRVWPCGEVQGTLLDPIQPYSGGASAGAAHDPWEARASCKTHDDVPLLRCYRTPLGCSLHPAPFSAPR